MSNVWVSKSMSTLYMLIPAIFKLPTFIPEFVHLFSLEFLACFILAEPFVLFLRFLVYTELSLCAHCGTLFSLLHCSLIIVGILVALAHGGANPMPTPAGQKLGG
jgi:hypothetical protein